MEPIAGIEPQAADFASQTNTSFPGASGRVVAVRGSEHSIISEAFLRAIHAVICAASLEGRNTRPDPAQIRELAERFIREGVK